MIPLRRTCSKALPLLLLLALQVASAQASAEAIFRGYKPLEQASDQFGAEVSLLLDDERVRTMPGAEDPAIFDLWKRGLALEADESLLASTRIYQAITRVLPEDPHAYWRIARNLWRHGESLSATDKIGREEHFVRSVEWAERGLAVDDECGECMLWKFVSMGRLATTRGILSAIRQAKEMSQMLERGIALAPTHADTSANTTLGNLYYSGAMFYRIVPDSFWVRLLIGVRGDKKRSLDYIQRAVAISPQRVDYQVELGAVLLCLANESERADQHAEGLRVLGKAVGMDPLLSTDTLDIEHARMLQKKPERACGYSRDGFIDVDGVIGSHEARVAQQDRAG